MVASAVERPRSGRVDRDGSHFSGREGIKNTLVK